jgi:hypothetical protein
MKKKRKYSWFSLHCDFSDWHMTLLVCYSDDWWRQRWSKAVIQGASASPPPSQHVFRRWCHYSPRSPKKGRLGGVVNPELCKGKRPAHLYVYLEAPFYVWSKASKESWRRPETIESERGGGGFEGKGQCVLCGWKEPNYLTEKRSLAFDGSNWVGSQKWNSGGIRHCHASIEVCSTQKHDSGWNCSVLPSGENRFEIRLGQELFWHGFLLLILLFDSVQRSPILLIMLLNKS